MTTPRDLPRDIGSFIRDLRRNARISLRQLAEQSGVSNPYLSQIERGLRKPSAEVLAQIASALRVSTPVMFLRAGLLDPGHGPGVLTAIAADPQLTVSQKQALSQIYETFRRDNARLAGPDGGWAADLPGAETTETSSGKVENDNGGAVPAGQARPRTSDHHPATAPPAAVEEMQ